MLVVQDPTERSKWLSSIPCTYPVEFILLRTWGNRRCAPPVVVYVVMTDGSIHEGVFLIENLMASDPMGLVSSFAT